MAHLTLTLPSLAYTHAIAAGLAPHLRAGDALLLDGPLGVGKTAFVQGLAHALGVEAPVTSPTFAIANVHTGARLPLLHVDAYRLESVDAFRDLALEEQLEAGIACIEWGARIEPAFPQHLGMQLEFAGDDARRLSVTSRGARWSEAWPTLARSLQDVVR